MTSNLMKRNEDFFNTFGKALIGFDSLPSLYSESNYPRYNLFKNGEDYLIEISVVGLAREDLEIKLKNGLLSIKGKHQERPEELKVLHKGISEKPFEKHFNLDGSLTIGEVTLEKGLLRVEVNKEPEDEYLLDIKEIK